VDISRLGEKATTTTTNGGTSVYIEVANISSRANEPEWTQEGLQKIEYAMKARIMDNTIKRHMVPCHVTLPVP